MRRGFAPGRSTRIAVVGGPSYFTMTQGLVTDVSVGEAYPDDTVTFMSARRVDSKRSRLGNVGFDFTELLTQHFGVGVVGRWSRASFKFPIVNDENATIKADVWL
jgi:hypothetical protein